MQAIEHTLGTGLSTDRESNQPRCSLTTMAKNIGFILKNVPSAAKKAVEHFNRAIEGAKEIGAKGIEGQAYLDLGHLQKLKGRRTRLGIVFPRLLRSLKNARLRYT